jgi:hypothetical protein
MGRMDFFPIDSEDKCFLFHDILPFPLLVFVFEFIRLSILAYRHRNVPHPFLLFLRERASMGDDLDRRIRFETDRVQTPIRSVGWNTNTAAPAMNGGELNYADQLVCWWLSSKVWRTDSFFVSTTVPTDLTKQSRDPCVTWDAVASIPVVPPILVSRTSILFAWVNARAKSQR